MGRFSSLATAGGNLAILIGFTLLLGGATVILMLKYGATTPAVTTVSIAFANFSGALLGILRGTDTAQSAKGVLDANAQPHA